MPENEVEGVEGVEEVEEVLPPEGDPTYLTEILQKTPWWAISVAFHAVVLLILWKLNFGISGPRRVEVELVARLEKKEEPEYDPEKPRDIKKTPLTDADSDIDAPVIETEITEFDDHFETDDDMELSETAKGFENAMGLEDAGSIGVIGGPGGGGRGRYGFRTGGGKRRAIARGGGKGTESAVMAGLRWLARHQAPDGGWHTNTWHEECPSNDSCVGVGGGRANDTPADDYSTAVTGFALLAFLGAGHTHQTGKFRKTVKDGLDYLMKAQDGNGKFGRAGALYANGIACLAAVEAYGMTRSKKYKTMAQDGIDYIVYVQNPLGGWNYNSPHSRNDMSVSAWQIMALKSAKVGGLNVPQETIYRVIRWMEIATREPDGSVCYQITADNPNAEYPGGGGSIRMRAAGMLCHLFFGKERGAPIMTASGNVFLDNLPNWAGGGNPETVGGVDLYYWYYATLVNFQLGGKYWKGWNKAMKDAILANQIKGKIDADGSWPPVDKYSKYWSRPGMTALCVLSLEVYYRYLPVYMK